jgi:hypothetical protein
VCGLSTAIAAQSAVGQGPPLADLRGGAASRWGLEGWPGP